MWVEDKYGRWLKENGFSNSNMPYSLNWIKMLHICNQLFNFLSHTEIVSLYLSLIKIIWQDSLSAKRPFGLI